MGGIFKPGHKKVGGRKKGTPNKSTIVTRDMVASLLGAMHEHLPDKIAELEAKDYVSFYAKMQEFNLPKLQRTEVDAVVSNRTSIEDELKDLSEE